MIPTYLSLLDSGELERRVAEAYRRLEACTLCPRNCKNNRRAGKLGVCRTGDRARVASYGPHHGEEGPLSGARGSGTVFFSRCNLRCVYCQNAEISQSDQGREVEPEELADIFLELQAMGCHNINLVTPDHVIPMILAALVIAARGGLRLPLVYNTSGYAALESLALLDGVIDIYMPDMKYSDPKNAHLYSGARNYPLINQAAVREMYRQVGDLQIGEDTCTSTQVRCGIAVRGLLVRHLVLPNRVAGTREILRFLAEEISPLTYLNLMCQYRPEFHAASFPALNRTITAREFQDALEAARQAGLQRIEH